MLSIRLSRTGKKKHPLYSLIVVEKSKDPWGDNVEKLGTYNPHTKASEIKADRVTFWISKGAQPTPTVHNLLVNLGLIKADKVRAGKTQPGKKRTAQIESDKKAAEEAKAKAETDAKAVEEAAKATIETPVEEVVTEAVTEEKPAEEVVETINATPAEEAKTE
ncbi:MAG: 30S ribosomal protein S16 [Patescibacteria group bacterium]|jgi:small subunit ribosomal protein S16